MTPPCRPWRALALAGALAGLAAAAPALEWVVPSADWVSQPARVEQQRVCALLQEEDSPLEAWAEALSRMALEPAYAGRRPAYCLWPGRARKPGSSWSEFMADRYAARLLGRPVPDFAASVLPALKEAFAGEGVPPELVWIAEVESAFDPEAQSPSGAVGLFQFKPATAERFGLRTGPDDERTSPAKSARAAARYLRCLHGEFGSWPLAVAAYNAGEGCVGRALRAAQASTFDEIVAQLPAQTRAYVPRVMATVGLRERVSLESLPAPAPPPLPAADG